jgi:hypothetical protein
LAFDLTTSNVERGGQAVGGPAAARPSRRRGYAARARRAQLALVAGYLRACRDDGERSRDADDTVGQMALGEAPLSGYVAVRRAP